MKANQDAFYENERLEVRVAELEELLREGVEGFGHVLVQTSDQAGVNDWRSRARELLGEAK